MNKLRLLASRIRFALGRSSKDHEIDEELRFHLETEAEDRHAAGAPMEEARFAARRQLGNRERVRESTREIWGWLSLDRLMQDLRYALRTLRQNPGFTATAVLSLALGIGANTAIFSIVNAVMLRSLPVEDPQRLVQIKIDEHGDEFTNPLWEQVRDHQQAFTGVLAYGQDRFDLAGGGESRFAAGLWVSGDFFRVLGVSAMQGRMLTTGDDRRGGGSAGPVAVISYSFWKRNFPGDGSVIGQTIHLNRHPFEIVGVTPPWFGGLDVDHGFDVAIPIGCEPILHAGNSSLDMRANWWLRILGRLGPGTSVQVARDQIKAISPEIFRATLPAEFPSQVQADYLKRSFSLHPAGTGFSITRWQYGTALFTLMAIVGLVLLIACANIANLLMARAAARQREFSVRMAMGASRWRIVRQLMTESLLLSVLGAGGGLLLALWGSRLLARLLSTARNPLEIDLSPDLRVLAFTAGAAILTALLFGLAPALRATRLELNQVLKENVRNAVAGSTRFHLGKALVTGQVALSLVLLVGAGLFVGTLRNLLTVDPGFRSHNVLLITADAQQTTVPSSQRVRVYHEILERIQTVPGVVAAASSVITPLSGRGWAQNADPQGFVAKSPREKLVFFNRVSPGYFQTLGTALPLGRDFSEHDDLRAPRVMIINEAAARRFFGQADPIGKTMGLDEGGPGKPDTKVVYQIIGVVKDSKYDRINEETRRLGYLAAAQDADPTPDIRYEVGSGRMVVESLIPSIRASIAGVNKDISLEFKSFEAQVDETLVQPRTVALLSTVFGALALLLAMVGLYGNTTYAAARRRGEIGIRMALGAQRSSVIWLMLRDVLMLLAVGVSVGVAASLALGRLVASLLYGVQPNDAGQLAGAALILAAATAVAAYLPARRAAGLDPMAALREE